MIYSSYGRTFKAFYMADEQENHDDHDIRPFTKKSLNQALAILFVFAIYLVIFLKILFIK